MPRGRKPVPKTYEEQILFYENQIEEHKLVIDKLKNQLKSAKAAKKKKDAEDLMDAIEASGKTIQQVLTELQQNSQQNKDA